MEKYQKITVGGFLLVEGKVLLLKRSKKEELFSGYFELPGGKVEFSHTPKESVEREFFEETNLKVKCDKILRVFSYVTNNNLRHTVELVFLVKLNDEIKNIKLSDEHDEFVFSEEKDLENLNLTKEMKENIKECFRIISFG